MCHEPLPCQPARSGNVLRLCMRVATNMPCPSLFHCSFAFPQHRTSDKVSITTAVTHHTQGQQPIQTQSSSRRNNAESTRVRHVIIILCTISTQNVQRPMVIVHGLVTSKAVLTSKLARFFVLCSSPLRTNFLLLPFPMLLQQIRA